MATKMVAAWGAVKTIEKSSEHLLRRKPLENIGPVLKSSKIYLPYKFWLSPEVQVGKSLPIFRSYNQKKPWNVQMAMLSISCTTYQKEPAFQAVLRLDFCY